MPVLKSNTIGAIVLQIKSISTKKSKKNNDKNNIGNHNDRIIGRLEIGRATGAPLRWQRNYHEHIIRNEQSHQIIAEYIQNNPSQWEHDKFYRNELVANPDHYKLKP